MKALQELLYIANFLLTSFGIKCAKNSIKSSILGLVRLKGEHDTVRERDILTSLRFSILTRYMQAYC